MNTNSPSVWRAGQKVICIDDVFPQAVMDWCDCLPVAGSVYTIRALQLGRDGVTGLGSLGFLLEEIVNPLSSLGCEAGFVHTRFVAWLDAYMCKSRANNDSAMPIRVATSKQT